MCVSLLGWYVTNPRGLAREIFELLNSTRYFFLLKSVNSAIMLLRLSCLILNSESVFSLF